MEKVQLHIQMEQYVGNLKKEMHGKGTFTYSDGNKYVGEWKENKNMEKVLLHILMEVHLIVNGKII